MNTGILLAVALGIGFGLMAVIAFVGYAVWKHLRNELTPAIFTNFLFYACGQFVVIIAVYILIFAEQLHDGYLRTENLNNLIYGFEGYLLVLGIVFGLIGIRVIVLPKKSDDAKGIFSNPFVIETETHTLDQVVYLITQQLVSQPVVHFYVLLWKRKLEISSAILLPGAEVLPIGLHTRNLMLNSMKIGVTYVINISIYAYGIRLVE